MLLTNLRKLVLVLVGLMAFLSVDCVGRAESQKEHELMADGKRIYSEAKNEMDLFATGEAPEALKKWFAFFGVQQTSNLEAKVLESTAVAYHFPAKNPKTSIKPVVLVHGYLEHCGYLYQHINRFYAENRSVICLDLPGHGLSKFESKWSIDDFRRYAVAIWELAGYTDEKFAKKEPLVLCHSTGCVGFLDLLLASPQYLEKGLRDMGIKNNAPDLQDIEHAQRHQFGFGKIYFLAPLVEVRAHALIAFASSILPFSSIPRLGGVSYEQMRRLLKIDPANQLFFPTSWTKRYLEWHKKRDWKPNPLALTRLIVDKKDSVIDSSAAISLVKSHLNNEIILTDDADHFLWFYKDMPSLIK